MLLPLLRTMRSPLRPMLSSIIAKRNPMSTKSENDTQLPLHMVEFFDKRARDVCFDRVFNSRWRVVSAPDNSGTCVVELRVDEHIANVNKTIHGGALASLIDAVSTAALYNTAQRKTGVSVDLHVSFVKAAKVNETIVIEGKVVKAGSKIAYLSGNIFLKDDKKSLVATGSHTKFIG